MIERKMVNEKFVEMGFNKENGWIRKYEYGHVAEWLGDDGIQLILYIHENLSNKRNHLNKRIYEGFTVGFSLYRHKTLLFSSANVARFTYTDKQSYEPHLVSVINIVKEQICLEIKNRM